MQMQCVTLTQDLKKGLDIAQYHNHTLSQTQTYVPPRACNTMAFTNSPIL